MIDPRTIKLAQNIVNYSCSVKPGEKVLIQTSGLDTPFTKALINEVYKAGGLPFVQIGIPEIDRALLMGCTEEQLELRASHEMTRMKDMDVVIIYNASENDNETSDVPAEKLTLYSKAFIKLALYRTQHTKWTYLRYPNPSTAQSAGMSTEAFEEFLFKVCTFDYSKMSLAMDNLVKIMEKTDKVRIKGKGTDLTFSIKGLPAIKCDGKLNVPDGEVFSAPVKNSVNGVITYNTPSKYRGTTYENICLEFKDGKIIKATANDTEGINKIFDTDEGARYVGEFAIGVNPYINNPMKDILYDEKINGSFHFTPGASYDMCDNGNKSAVHWDLVCIQRPEYGGGEVWFDDVLIRKDGLFVIEELKCLNPESLV